MKKFLILWIFFIYSSANAAALSEDLISTSRQLIVIVTPTLDAVKGRMLRFERRSTKDPWKRVGKTVPVVVGRNGLAWDLTIRNNYRDNTSMLRVKHEGDGCTPIGVYLIGPEFGFDRIPNRKGYFPLNEKSVCVDDSRSNYYNQLIDSSKVSHVDWKSGEQMYKVAQYKFGVMIQYNQKPVAPGRGSCIFMHIWKSASFGTSGCIAMNESVLKKTLNWLDSSKNPVIAIFPIPEHQSLISEWQLPHL